MGNILSLSPGAQCPRDTFVQPIRKQPKPKPITEIAKSRPHVIVPSDRKFTVSVNGRHGWSFGEVYSGSPKEVSERLGVGGFGTVFRSTHRFPPPGGLDKEWGTVAVKITSPYYAGKRGSEEKVRSYNDVERLCQEVKTLMRLQEHGEQHNILLLYEYFWSSGQDPQVHLVTELLGMDLREWFKNHPQPLTERVASEVAKRILSAIEFCHDRGIMHRDLKPDNILFKENGDYKTLKIVDFGLARVLDSELTHGICGSPGFLAPEMYQYENYGREIDMFSFGVIIFLMMSGEKPFQGNAKVLVQKTLQLAYHVDQGNWTAVSQDAKNLVSKLLAFREDRLDATQALGHKWFKIANDSHSLATPHYGKSYRILQLEETVSDSQEDEPAGPNNAEHPRFWIDRTVHEALVGLVSPTGRFLYNGTVVPDSESDIGGAVLVEERIPRGGVILPYYIASRQSYTECDGRIVCKKIAEAIRALHDAGVAHRNIHLGNFIVEEGDGHLGIDDIHLSVQGVEYAQMIRDDQPLSGRFGRKYSRYAFTAPEMENSFVHDARVDLWSFGATMYMVLCGIGPFRADGEQLMVNKLSGHIEFDMVVLSESAMTLIRRLLQARPEDRVGTIREVLTHDWISLPDAVLRQNDLEVARLIFGDYATVV